VGEVALLALILSGFLPFLVRLGAQWRLSLIPAGLLFFVLPGLILHAIEIPFDYYNTFVLEEKYGFNRYTVKLWIADQVKAGLVGAALFAVLLSLVLAAVRFSPDRWWLWGFLVVSFVQIALAELYPLVIAPLFNKFTAVADEALAARIGALMERGGIAVKTILRMDAGRRSRHTNAYFTGLGKAKRIVLFDTLLDSHPGEEILGVLAHEAGHYKKRHVLKQMAVFEIILLASFYLAYCLLGWAALYRAFGFEAVVPFAGLFLISIFAGKLGFFVKPLFMAFSRRFEREADLFSVGLLGSAAPMIASLKRIAVDNLANLDPHPLYVLFNYSHPPLVERIKALDSAERAGGTPAEPERRM
jgi:STE24 endopeptidase